MPPAEPPARLPWDFHPALTEERLRLIADDGYAGPATPPAVRRPCPPPCPAVGLPAPLSDRRPRCCSRSPAHPPSGDAGGLIEGHRPRVRAEFKCESALMLTASVQSGRVAAAPKPLVPSSPDQRW